MNQDAWTFICDLYALPGVKRACLAMQDRLGLSVTTLLTLIWAGQSGRGAIAPERLEAALEAVHLWHEEVTRSLRHVRRQLGDAAALRQRAFKDTVLNAELEAERLEQQVLLRDLDLELPEEEAPTGAWPDAVHNAAAYIRRFAPAPDAQTVSELSLILSAALPDPDGPHLTAVLADCWMKA